MLLFCRVFLKKQCYSHEFAILVVKSGDRQCGFQCLIMTKVLVVTSNAINACEHGTLLSADDPLPKKKLLQKLVEKKKEKKK